MRLPIEFDWNICADSYEIVEAIPVTGGERPLSCLLPCSSRRRTLNLPSRKLFAFLFEHPNPNPDQVINYANVFGALTLGQPLQVVVGGRIEQRQGEPLGYWQTLAPQLRHAVTTWRMGCVHSWEEWDEFFFEGRRPPPSRPGSNDDLADLKEGSCDLAAQMVGGQLRQRLGLNLAAPDFAAKFQPQDMRDYLWLELGLAIASGGQPEQCSSCGDWYLVSKGQGRTDKRYCSDACRMRAYRARRKRD